MTNQEIHDPKDYSEEIRKLLTSDPAHADTFNPLFERLINNDVFMKALVERMIKEHSHDGTDDGGTKIPFANIEVPAGDGGIVTDKDLAYHINERNPHGSRAVDIGAASAQEFTTHLAEKASPTKLGHVMVGNGLSIASDGKLSVVVTASPIPSGLISMWSGAINAIPSDWALCDGTNGTPNLIDRFIVGAGGNYAVGATGGADNVALTTAQLPSHSHGSGTLSAASAGSHSHGSGTLSTNTAGAHTHTFNGKNQLTDGYSTLAKGAPGYQLTQTSASTSSDGSHSHTISGSTASSGSHSHTISGSTAETGSGQAHENRPPYYALAYIMKI